MSYLITPHDSSAWARQVPEHAMPNLVVSQMTNSIRAGKVLFGWSSTRPPRSRSPRTRCAVGESPTVAARRSWDELAAPHLGQLSFRQVLGLLAAGLEPMRA
jgi:bifunctional non-homologous end joining protein LigD